MPSGGVIIGVLAMVCIVAGVFAVAKSLYKALLSYMIAIMVMSAMMVIAPIFISFVLFEVTKPLFMNWLRLMIRYTMEPAILFAGMILLTEMAHSALAQALRYSVCVGCGLKVLFGENFPEIIADMLCIPVIYAAFPFTSSMGGTALVILVNFLLFAIFAKLMEDYCGDFCKTTVNTLTNSSPVHGTGLMGSGTAGASMAAGQGGAIITSAVLTGTDKKFLNVMKRVENKFAEKFLGKEVAAKDAEGPVKLGAPKAMEEAGGESSEKPGAAAARTDSLKSPGAKAADAKPGDKDKQADDAKKGEADKDIKAAAASADIKPGEANAARADQDKAAAAEPKPEAAKAEAVPKPAAEPAKAPGRAAGKEMADKLKEAEGIKVDKPESGAAAARLHLAVEPKDNTKGKFSRMSKKDAAAASAQLKEELPKQPAEDKAAKGPEVTQRDGAKAEEQNKEEVAKASERPPTREEIVADLASQLRSSMEKQLGEFGEAVKNDGKLEGSGAGGLSTDTKPDGGIEGSGGGGSDD